MTTLRTTAARSRCGGFTLIELAVVLILIGIVLSIVIPRYGGFLTRGTLRSELRRLAAVVRYLSDEASRSGRTYYLNFDIRKGTYWVTVDAGTSRAAEVDSHLTRIRQLPENVRFKDVMVYGTGKKSTGRQRIAFFPGGENEEAIVHSSDYDKRQIYSLHIKPYAGRSDIYDYEYKGYTETHHKAFM
jgi:prepilin-type N-terminal cleavage/methylation domain-containing protein